MCMCVHTRVRAYTPYQSVPFPSKGQKRTSHSHLISSLNQLNTERQGAAFPEGWGPVLTALERRLSRLLVCSIVLIPQRTSRGHVSMPSGLHALLEALDLTPSAAQTGHGTTRLYPPNTWDVESGGATLQGHPRLHGVLEASLGYRRPVFKNIYY